MHYVYLIESVSHPGHRYVGETHDLRARLKEHNAGKSRHTSKYVPWELVTYLGFNDRTKAEAFEVYLEIRLGARFGKQTALVRMRDSC